MPIWTIKGPSSCISSHTPVSQSVTSAAALTWADIYPLDHCLDYLRQSVMCHLDYSMYTVYWGERQQDIPTHHAPGAQKCVNWEKLHRWMLERSASTDMLVRPRRWSLHSRTGNRANTPQIGTIDYPERCFLRSLVFHLLVFKIRTRIKDNSFHSLY